MSSEMHDQIKDKFLEVFSKRSDLNQTKPLDAVLLLSILALWPLIESTDNQEYHMSLRIILVFVVANIIRNTKPDSRSHPKILVYLGISLQLFSNLIFVYQEQSNQHCQNYLITIAFLILISSRFELHHIREITYSISMISLITQIYLQNQVFSIIKYFVIAVIAIEGIQWRTQFLKRDYNSKMADFTKELDQMKEYYNEQIMKLQDYQESEAQQQLSSRANDLLKKLRLIKYQQLLMKNNTFQKGIRKPKKMNSEIHQNAFSLKQLPEDNVPDEQSSIQQDISNHHFQSIQNDNQPPQFRRKSQRLMTSATDQNCRINESSNSPSFSEKNIEEMKITTEDIDDLLNLLSGKKESIWLPKFLRSNQLINEQEGFSVDAKQFLLSHFTQKQPSFEYIQDIQDHVQEEELERIDFNADFLHFYRNKSQDNNQTRIFFENTITFFKRFKIAQTFKITKPELIREFALKVDMSYHNNLYHNSMHALDVTNSTGFFLENGVNEMLDEFEQACLIISSLVHDIGHPGLNNGFMMSNRCKLAMLYNDQSVLENYHSFLLFQILSQDQFNIIQNLGQVEQKGFRKYCLNLILDTDLTKHFQLMNRFQNYLELTESTEMDKNLLMSICIKCADVGHGAKKLQIHKLWSRRIIEEFFLQGDLESYLKVPVSPMCDRKQCVTKSQEGFLKAIVLPMFNAFVTLLQNEKVAQVCLEQIHENLKYWQEQIDDVQFMKETQIDIPGLENLKKFLNSPLQLCV
ncbi:unnamed protein product (macronuclear) [Paramecium tetraurelia]|uniref:Phosphodiesterase n=1 Tax=Paramecium tetraurelia TaxID=5888 RepID=A0E8K4_PARTE|nr:uncharacterized protein GSPATT00024350001 [Paramecium tetraurelia]CAK91621.1 unnamed protein product [Paramecium tetraurelia]|eukprot:XP_001459018.1 hypothetical protein (macronuclear) [Paramecium tetraurelia strain d4-2]